MKENTYLELKFIIGGSLAGVFLILLARGCGISRADSLDPDCLNVQTSSLVLPSNHDVIICERDYAIDVYGRDQLRLWKTFLGDLVKIQHAQRILAIEMHVRQEENKLILIADDNVIRVISDASQVNFVSRRLKKDEYGRSYVIVAYFTSVDTDGPSFAVMYLDGQVKQPHLTYKPDDMMLLARN